MYIKNQVSQKKLEQELKRIQRKLGMGFLQVKWQPQEISTDLGYVKGNTIFINAKDEEVALWTLRHEVVELLLTEDFLLPRLYESKCHRQSDRLVDLLARLILNDEQER